MDLVYKTHICVYIKYRWSTGTALHDKKEEGSVDGNQRLRVNEFCTERPDDRAHQVPSVRHGHPTSSSASCCLHSCGVHVSFSQLILQHRHPWTITPYLATGVPDTPIPMTKQEPALH